MIPSPRPASHGAGLLEISCPQAWRTVLSCDLRERRSGNDRQARARMRERTLAPIQPERELPGRPERRHSNGGGARCAYSLRGAYGAAHRQRCQPHLSVRAASLPRLAVVAEFPAGKANDLRDPCPVLDTWLQLRRGKRIQGCARRRQPRARASASDDAGNVLRKPLRLDPGSVADAGDAGIVREGPDGSRSLDSLSG